LVFATKCIENWNSYAIHSPLSTSYQAWLRKDLYLSDSYPVGFFGASTGEMYYSLIQLPLHVCVAKVAFIPNLTQAV
jgi:hypothetical protein